MNISAVNYNNTDNVASVSRVAGAQTADNTFDNTLIGEKIFSKASVSGHMTSTRMDDAAKAGLMGELESVKEQLQVSAQAAKDSLKALFQKMDGSAPVYMDEDGYNLNDMEPEEIVTVVERIQIMLATYCDDYDADLSGVDSDKIEAVTGSKASAEIIKNKLQQAGIADTDENVNEAEEALKMAQKINEPDDDVKLYLVANNLELSIDNLFKASYGADKSGVLKAAMAQRRGELSEKEWQSLKNQAIGIIKNAGLEVNDTTLGYAKKLIENDISVDEKNLKKMMMLDELDVKKTVSDTNELLERIVKNMTEGRAAKDTPIAGEMPVDSLKQITEVISKAGYDDVAQLTYEGKPFTVLQLKLSYTAADYNYVLDDSGMELANSRYEQLISAKMLLMSGAGATLIKLNVDIQNIAENKTVPELLSNLYEADNSRMLYDSSEEQRQVFDVRMAAFKIGQSSISVVAESLYQSSGAVTLSSLAAKAWNVSARIRTAQATYDAVGTEVRKDLKDSLFKAVSASAGSLLKDMDLQDNELNRSAVRILSENNMDVTRENVLAVKEQYSEVKRLIDNMKPQVVLDMIRDGINPMETDISVLNDYLEQHYEGGKDERFSRFLYKLDRQGGITAQERKQFIGIYKMMNIFKKDAGRAVGTLYNSRAEFTMSNLVAGYNAWHAAGKDIRISDETGMAQVEGSVRYFDNLFSAVASKITPDTLYKTNREKAVDDRGIEEFCEAIDKYYDSAVESEMLENYVSQLKERADESGISYLLDRMQLTTLDNIMAAHELLMKQADNSSLKKMSAKFKAGFGSDSLSEVYESAVKESDEELETAYQTDDMDYARFERLRMQNRKIHLMANLAKRNEYHIPYEEDGGIGMIHLQVVEGGEKGRASVKMNRASGSEAVVEITVSGNVLRLYGLDSENGDYMKEALERVADSDTVQDMYFESVKITAGKSEAIPNPTLKTDDKPIKNSALFAIAGEVIRALSAN